MNRSFVAAAMAGAISLGGCATTDPYGDTSYRDDSTVRGVAGGAVAGGALGAAAGAVIGGINPLEGALIGAAVGGLAGAVWADRNNDGRTDGYYSNGQYYEGAPQPGAYSQPAPAPYYPPPPVRRSGERG